MPAPVFKASYATNYHDDFCRLRGYQVDQSRVVPVDPARRNNPHPHDDFVNIKAKMSRVDPTMVKQAVKEYMDNLVTASGRSYDEYTPYMDTPGRRPVVSKSHVPRTQRGLIGTSNYPTTTHQQIMGQYANDRNQRRFETVTGKDDYVSYTPLNMKPKCEQPHWIQWKTGATPEPVDTSAYDPPLLRPRAPAPPIDMYSGEEGFADDTHEVLNDEEPCFQDIPGKQADGYSTYVPGFRTWVSGGDTNYDKEVVYSMLKKLHGSGRTGDIRHNHRAYSATQPRPAPHQTTRSIQSATSRYEHPINFERRAINTLYKNLGRTENLNNGYNSYSGDRYYDRPTAKHMYRKSASGNFTHENSFFMKTQPTVKSHFIINPEWVSENKGARKNMSHMRSGPNSLRYGSK